jgi:hypothetical protein
MCTEELTTEEMESALVKYGVIISVEKKPDGDFEYSLHGQRLIKSKNVPDNRHTSAYLFYKQLQEMSRNDTVAI